MGRILDALQQSTAPPCPPGPDEPDLAPAEADALVPFIEVGGPRGAVEASPTVLAPPAAPSPAVRRATGSPGGPRGVCFEPLPAHLAPGRPPQERFAPDLVAFHSPEHPVSGQYRRLLDALLARLPRAQRHVVLFLGAAAGVGATTAVLNTALTLARRGKVRVAVVDANAGAPAVADRLGLPSAPGLSEVAVGDLPLDRALYETGQENLVALTAGAECRASAEQVRPVLSRLRDRFDLVLVDGPCGTASDRALGLAAGCDAICLIVPRDRAETPAVQELARLIAQRGVLLGRILTGESSS